MGAHEVTLQELVKTGDAFCRYESFFSELADAVLKGSASQHSSWDTVISDGISGHFVGYYLHQVLSRQAEQNGIEAPRFIEYANGRALQVSRQADRHYRGVRASIAARRAGNVLIATELVYTGQSARRLAQTIEDTGARVAIAFLDSRFQQRTTRRHLQAEDATRQLYHPAVIPNGAAQKLRSELLREATGVIAAPDHILPIPNPSSRPALTAHAHEMVGVLVDEYYAARTITTTAG